MPGYSSNNPAYNSCLFIFIGLILVVMGVVSGCNDLRFKAGARQTKAVVSETWTTATKSGSSQHSYYDFEAGGKKYSGASGAHYKGEEVLIEYLPSNPTMNRELGSRAGIWALVGLIAGVALLFAGSIVCRKNEDLLSG